MLVGHVLVGINEGSLDNVLIVIVFSLDTRRDSIVFHLAQNEDCFQSRSRPPALSGVEK